MTLSAYVRAIPNGNGSGDDGIWRVTVERNGTVHTGRFDLASKTARARFLGELVEQHVCTMADVLEMDQRILAAMEETLAEREQQADKELSEDAPAGATGDPGRIHSLSEAICSEHRFARDAAGKLYAYDRGVYRPTGEQLVRRSVKAICRQRGPEWTKAWRPTLVSAVVEYIATDAPPLWERPPLDVLNVLNGLLKIKHKKPLLLPHSPDHLSTVQLPVAWDPDATCPAIDEFVQQTFPEDAISLAYEIAGWLMRPDTSIQKAVLLTGEGGNGKSRYLEMLRAFIGPKNCAGLSLHKLEANEYASARLVGKLANICPDLPSEHLAGTSVFKAITGGDALPAEEKFRPSFEFVPFCRLIFSANHPPRSSDGSQGFFDRWLVVPFDRSFRGTRQQIPHSVLDARLQAPSELSGLLVKAVASLSALARGRFTEPQSVREAFASFQAVTDPLAVWLDRHTIDDPDAMVPKKTLRVTYNAHLERTGRPPASERAFGLSVKKLRPDIEDKQRTINGKLQWCYLGIGLLTDLGADDDVAASRGSRDSRDNPALSSTREGTNTGGAGEKLKGGDRVNRVNPVNCDHTDPATFVRRNGRAYCPVCEKYMGRVTS